MTPPPGHPLAGFVLRSDQRGVLRARDRVTGSDGAVTFLTAPHQHLMARTRLGGDQGLFRWLSLMGAAFAGGMACLIGMACRAIRRERDMRAQFEAESLFLDAMDGIDASIIVFDKDLNTRLWNRGFQRAFPEAAARIRRGDPMARVIDGSGALPGDDPFAIEPKPRTTSDAVIARLRAGQDTTRLIRLDNGRVFEAREFPLGYDHYAAVRIDVTGMHRQAGEIRNRQRALERMNERLRVFSTVAAHDLRAPVQQLDALLDFVMEDFAEAGTEIPLEARDNLELIRRTAARMGTLVEDLLVYARSEGPAEPAERIAPSERLKEVAELAAIPAGFEIEIAADMPVVQLPATEFDTVFRNLISNAVKHHDRGAGRIRIAGQRMGDKVVFEAEDDGPGIPADSLDEIFEPFKRLTGHGDTAGSGLGLSFIRKSVEGWGGQVSALCRQSRGTVFRIVLPDRAARPDPPIALASAESLTPPAQVTA